MRPAAVASSNLLNLLEQHAINKTHEKDIQRPITPKTKQTHAKNPTMTPTSTAPVCTDDQQENVTVEDILEEQPLRTLKGKWNRWRGRILSWKARSILLKPSILY